MAMLNKQGVLISGEENPLESIYQSSMIRRSPQDASHRIPLVHASRIPW